MNKILSIIVPTYNMEQYLDRDLKSLIIEDKELMMSLEVLVVNDGSKDKSSTIAHNYETLYPDTFRVIDKENGNYGSCINRGLKEAKGKYIRIMDADDWYDTRNFEIYLRKLYDIDVDKIATIFSDVTDSGKKVREQPYPPEQVMNMEDVSEVNYIPMHAITYNTQFLRDLNYTQTEGMSYTDQEWILLPMPFVKTLYYIPLDVYQYYTGREGQTMDPKVMQKAYPQLFHALYRVLIEYRKSLPKATNPAYTLESVTRTIEWLYEIAFLTVRFQGNTECVKQMDEMIEESYPSIYQRLADKMLSRRLYRYHYVTEWRKRGRPLHISTQHERYYKLTHFYIGICRLPIYLIGVIQRRITKRLKHCK